MTANITSALQGLKTGFRNEDKLTVMAVGGLVTMEHQNSET